MVGQRTVGHETFYSRTRGLPGYIAFLNAIFKACKISKTKRRNTYQTGLVVKLNMVGIISASITYKRKSK